MTQGVPPLCFACARFRPWDADVPKAHCEAFPEGVPDDILFAGFDHRRPHEGDHGVRFELDPAKAGRLPHIEAGLQS